MQHALQSRLLEKQIRLAESKAVEARKLIEQQDVLRAKLAHTKGQIQALNGQLAGYREQALSAQGQLAKLLEERVHKPIEPEAQTPAPRAPGS